MTHVVLEETGFGIRAAVLLEGRLIEIRDGDRDDLRVTDALFAARVTSVDTKLNAAFIDCGLSRPGLLVAKDARAVAGSSERRPIRELVHEGQRLLVQGVREPVDDKGARFTTDIKLFGNALIHTPFGQRPEGAPLRGRRQGEQLRERGRTLFPAGDFALRRHAAELSDEVLRAEAAQLGARRQTLVGLAQNAKPGRLPAPETPLERLMRSLIDVTPETVSVADGPLAREVEHLITASPSLPPMTVAQLEPDVSAFAQTGVDAALDEALGTEVPLSRGGRLLIEPTAACVAIDVDGGGRAPLDVDLEAAAEIGRQVRLRNLGGTLIVDFVDLPTKPERQRLEEAVRKAFRGDPAPVEIHPMSSLGIMQISRARRGQALASLFLTSCTCCGGSGHRASPRADAEALFAALRHSRGQVTGIRVTGSLREFLAGAGKAAWRRAIDSLGLEPPLRVDAGLASVPFVIEERQHAR